MNSECDSKYHRHGIQNMDDGRWVTLKTMTNKCGPRRGSGHQAPRSAFLRGRCVQNSLSEPRPLVAALSLHCLCGWLAGSSELSPTTRPEPPKRPPRTMCTTETPAVLVKPYVPRNHNAAENRLPVGNAIYALCEALHLIVCVHVYNYNNTKNAAQTPPPSCVWCDVHHTKPIRENDSQDKGLGHEARVELSRTSRGVDFPQRQEAGGPVPLLPQRQAERGFPEPG